MDANTKFDIFYDQISQFDNYHVQSSPNLKLSYILSPGLLNLFVPKYDIKMSDKLYSKIIRCKPSNPNFIYLHKKFRNSVVEDVKASESDNFKNYFLCYKNNIKKSLVFN